MEARSGRAHPGTTVEWDEANWEVLHVEKRSSGGYRYYLIPWQEEHVVRVRVRYDDDSELELADGRERERLSRQVRRTLWLTGWFVGHLPADVQKRIAAEHAMSPLAPSYMSILPLWCTGVVALIFFIPTMVGVPAPLPPGGIIVGLYWFLESAIRFAWVFMTGEPIGSVAGWIAWRVHNRWTLGKRLKS